MLLWELSIQMHSNYVYLQKKLGVNLITKEKDGIIFGYINFQKQYLFVNLKNKLAMKNI